MSTSQTERLNIHFEEHGEPQGHVGLMLHGWPDDSSTWDAVIEKLASTG
jgi:pimeloyl-ACP methyl ester carboxylesterase